MSHLFTDLNQVKEREMKVERGIPRIYCNFQECLLQSASVALLPSFRKKMLLKR